MKDTLLLFDLDGTLWDSAVPVAEAWNEVFQREAPGLPLLTADDIHAVRQEHLDLHGEDTDGIGKAYGHSYRTATGALNIGHRDVAARLCAHWQRCRQAHQPRRKRGEEMGF